MGLEVVTLGASERVDGYLVDGWAAPARIGNAIGHAVFRSPRAPFLLAGWVPPELAPQAGRARVVAEAMNLGDESSLYLALLALRRPAARFARTNLAAMVDWAGGELRHWVAAVLGLSPPHAHVVALSLIGAEREVIADTMGTSMRALDHRIAAILAQTGRRSLAQLMAPLSEALQ